MPPHNGSGEVDRSYDSDEQHNDHGHGVQGIFTGGKFDYIRKRLRDQDALRFASHKRDPPEYPHGA